MSMPFLQPLNQPFSAYRSFPEYPVTFYDINHFFMYAAYFIRVYSGEKVADCSIRKSSTGMTMLNNGIDFLFLSSVKHLIFCGILYTLFI
jgi:hypothetical protein